jgi:predicted anti-sigma-YlaC factor YlaD
MLSGYDKKGKPLKKSNESTMLAVTGETDTILIADFFPSVLKLYDILNHMTPKHIGLAVTTGSFYVMYGNAFIQADAETLPISEFDLQNSELERAKMHYLRGRDIILDALNQKYPGFKQNILSGDAEIAAKEAARLKKDDVNAAYWAAAGWLGAFSLDPLNDELLFSTPGAVEMLERAASLDAGYSNGAIWDVLCAFYAAAPAEFGGDKDRALLCYEESVRIAGGKLPGPYVTYAQSFCVPSQDLAGFEEALEAALRVNPDDIPSSRLSTTITQKKARWLLENKDNYFIIWD